MTKLKQYSLARYSGPSSKITCPNCGEKTFKPYVDEDGMPFADDFNSADAKIRDAAKTVGRCDNERKCGWHYSPGQFFRDTKQGMPRHNEGWKPPPPPETAKPLDWSLVTQSFAPYHATFVQFLRDVAKLPADRLDQALRDYWIGASKDGRIAYWMIDQHGQCKDGKFMAYKPDGHRDHDINPYWARKKLITTYFRQHRITEEMKNKFLNMEVIRPYFGEHLLSDPRYKDKPVALVEGEKSCLICAIRHPRLIWIACGTNTFNVAKLLPVISQKRKLLIYPDVDQLDKWERLSKELNYPKLIFEGEYIKTHAQSEKDDVGDIMLREWMCKGDKLATKDAIQTQATTQPNTAEGEQPNVADEPEPWSDEERAQYRKLQMLVTENALGLEEPNMALRLLFEGLDLEIVSEQEFADDPEYEGF